LIKAVGIANFSFYALQMFVLFLTGITRSSFFIQNSNVYWSPLYVSNYYSKFAWFGIFSFEALFVIRGLVFSKISPHYQNCSLLKIKLNFIIVCLLFTANFILISAFKADASLLALTCALLLGVLVLMKSMT
jgi:hypothetical protein